MYRIVQYTNYYVIYHASELPDSKIREILPAIVDYEDYYGEVVFALIDTAKLGLPVHLTARVAKTLSESIPDRRKPAGG